MSEEDKIIIMTDENGNDVEFEFLDSIEIDGISYVVLLPEDDAQEGTVQIYKIIEGEEDLYVGIDDEEELNKVFEIFKQRTSDEYDFE